MILIVFLFLLTSIFDLSCLTYLIIAFSFFNTEFMSSMIVSQCHDVRSSIQFRT